jgi:hypothetical protein
MIRLTHIVNSSLKLDSKSSIARVLDLFAEVQRDPLALLVVCDVLRVLCRITCLQLSAVKLELVRIENNVIELLRVVDLEVNSNGSLVGELSAKLEVIEGDVVVGRLNPNRFDILALLAII